jgi:hypothetical protein
LISTGALPQACLLFFFSCFHGVNAHGWRFGFALACLTQCMGTNPPLVLTRTIHARASRYTTNRVAWYTPSPAYEPTDTKIHMGGLWDPKNKIRKIGGDSIYSGNRSIGDDIIIMKHNFHLGRRHARPFSVNTLLLFLPPFSFCQHRVSPSTPPLAPSSYLIYTRQYT